MDLVALVEQARTGDVDAFTALVREHQRLAHGCALAMLRDVDVAHDVVQEAFIAAAWRGLARLTEPASFPAWLRGIVRRQALHALRARHLEPLAHVPEVPSELPSAEQRMESARRRELALAALAGLPEGLREPAVLRWVYDCSHAQIAAFLGLPVTTVNNRLHAARVRLKRRIVIMAKDALRDPAFPDDLPARIGRIVRTKAPVVEAHFEPAGPPELLHTLIAADEAGRAVTLEIIQHMPNGGVRCILRGADAAPLPGAQVIEQAELAEAPLTNEALASALDRLLPRTPASPSVLLETGIKVIDVLMPLVRGRSVGVFGGERVGTTVFVEELVRRLATQTLSLFTFFPSVRAEGLRQIRDEGYTLGIGEVQTFFFRGDGRVREHVFDSVIVLSRAVAAAKLYPAIDHWHRARAGSTPPSWVRLTRPSRPAFEAVSRRATRWRGVTTSSRRPRPRAGGRGAFAASSVSPSS
jgi:RNA polymerase sigma-70 factor (ECF subfamily)